MLPQLTEGAHSHRHKDSVDEIIDQFQKTVRSPNNVTGLPPKKYIYQKKKDNSHPSDQNVKKIKVKNLSHFNLNTPHG